jgi:hypothetical protein
MLATLDDDQGTSRGSRDVDAAERWRRELAEATADAKHALERIDKAKRMLARLKATKEAERKQTRPEWAG